MCGFIGASTVQVRQRSETRQLVQYPQNVVATIQYLFWLEGPENMDQAHVTLGLALAQARAKAKTTNRPNALNTWQSPSMGLPTSKNEVLFPALRSVGWISFMHVSRPACASHIVECPSDFLSQRGLQEGTRCSTNPPWCNDFHDVGCRGCECPRPRTP